MQSHELGFFLAKKKVHINRKIPNRWRTINLLVQCGKDGWEGERVDRLCTERHPGVWHNGGLESDGVKG